VACQPTKLPRAKINLIPVQKGVRETILLPKLIYMAIPILLRQFKSNTIARHTFHHFSP